MTSKVRFATHIREIGREAWDALAGEELFANYDWLMTLENSQARPRQSMYWWVEDADGLLVAVTARLRAPEHPAWNIDQRRYGPMAYVIRPLRSLFQRRPTLVCGAQMAQGQPVLTRPGLSAANYHSLVSEILDAIESQCRELRLGLVFRGIVDAEESLRKAFDGRPYIVGAEWPGTVIDIRWDSIPAYLKDLRQTHPASEKLIRQQINRLRRSDIVVEELADPSIVEEELHRLLSQHHFRKNRNPYYMGPNFVTELKKNLGDRAVCIVARKDGRILGVSIHMRNSTAIALKFVGIAPDWVKSREAVYFNVTYQKVIEMACKAGVQQLYLGILTYKPKCHRGARLVPTSSWVWEPTTFRYWVQWLLLCWQARRQKRLLAHYTTQNQLENPLPCYKWPPRPRAG